ncbi:MAG: PIN domain-containing protein [Acidobacteria bacterium]|nr:PIN domain-containing protein [Acidobacteriota bacterium]
MHGSGKVLVDTSVWIDFFRRTEPGFSVVQRLLAEDRVCSAGIVVAEMMQGAKSEKELSVLRDFVHVFEFLHESPATWLAAGELSFRMRRKGKTIGLADCHIAMIAKENDVEILSLDSHFVTLEEEAGLRLFKMME